MYDELNNRYEYEVVASFNYLTKYSKSGSKVWRVYTNSVLTDLAIDSSGNIYATSNNALTKYTSTGARSWTRANSETPNSVTVSSTNNVYIVRQDGAVVKYNASGTQLWFKTGALDGVLGSGYNSGGEGYKIAAGLSDELYVTGARFNSEYESCDASYFVANYTIRAFKLSSTGARKWVKDVTSGTLADGDYSCNGDYVTYLSGLGVAADINGNVYIAGFQDSGVYQGGTYYQDGFVAKYSRAGTFAWKKGFGTSKADTATSVASYDGSEVFVGGVTNGSLVHRQLGNGDAVMREVNSSGNLVWAR